MASVPESCPACLLGLAPEAQSQARWGQTPSRCVSGGRGSLGSIALPLPPAGPLPAGPQPPSPACRLQSSLLSESPPVSEEGPEVILCDWRTARVRSPGPALCLAACDGRPHGCWQLLWTLTSHWQQLCAHTSCMPWPWPPLLCLPDSVFLTQLTP